ncbi:MAG: hypothetical protein WDA60_05520 [Acidimicrobiia bacterium]|jgi:hypothetical protein
MSLRLNRSSVRSFPLLVVVAALVLGAFVAAPAGAAKGGPPKLKDPSATGRELSTRFLTILQRGDKAALAKFLDPAFQLQRADGTGVNKAEYVAKPALVGKFVLGDKVIAAQNGDILSVRWALKSDITVGGQPYSNVETPRISTYHWYKNGWRLAAHANFNRPA